MRGAVVTAAEMYGIDSKIDDGITLQGKVWAGLGRMLDNSGWASCRLSATAYNLSLAGLSCNPIFFLN